MRKNTARHWLHATLDLLPVILIPVFMIYSHRHTMTQQTTVDIQYKYQSNEVSSTDDLVEGNIYLTNWQDMYPSDFLHEGEYLTFQLLGNLSVRDASIGDFLVPTSFTSYTYLQIYPSDTALFITDFNDDYIMSFDNFGDFANDIVIKIIDINIVDTRTSISSIFSFTNYNEIESVEVNDETSSVMNVFMDNFNGAVDKYFNMGNVFNLTGVYQWFNTNIFGGNAPIIIYSVWNIALYELVMDLLFLLYALFMWFIDMCKRLMEKPLDSIK